MAPSLSSSSNRPVFSINPNELAAASRCFPTASNVTEAFAAQGVSTQTNPASLRQELSRSQGLFSYMLGKVDEAVESGDKKALERARFACEGLTSVMTEQINRIDGALGLPPVPHEGRDLSALFASPLPKVPLSRSDSSDEEVGKETFSSGESAAGRKRKREQESFEEAFTRAQEQGLLSPPDRDETLRKIILEHNARAREAEEKTSPPPIIATTKGRPTPQTPSFSSPSGSSVPVMRLRSGAAITGEGSASKRKRRE